jgi:hypothetical protein
MTIRADYPTQSDLSAFIGRLVRLNVGNKLELNTSAGTASLGVLHSVFTVGGIQWGHLHESEQELPCETDGVAIASGQPLTNNAVGQIVQAVGPVITQGVSVRPSNGNILIAQFFTLLGPPASGNSTPVVAAADEVVEGSGIGLQSSPNFKYSPSTGILTVLDKNGAPLFRIDGSAAPTRKVQVQDATGVVMFDLDARTGVRRIGVPDSLNALMLIMDTLAANRLTSLVDETGQPILDVNGVAAVRTIQAFDVAGAPLVEIDTTASRTAAVVDPAGNVIFGVVGTAAGRQRLTIDSANVAMESVDTKAANRTFKILDAAAVLIEEFDTTAATRALEWVDETGKRVFGAFMIAAGAGIAFGPKAAGATLFWDNNTFLFQGFDSAGNLTWTLDPATGVVDRPAVSPAALAAGSTQDYAGATGGWCRITPDAGAGSALGGMVAERDGSEKILFNIGTKGLTINDADGGSLAANQFSTSTGANVLIAPKHAMRVIYDGISGFWRELSLTP